jgi:hypothetical protein
VCVCVFACVHVCNRAALVAFNLGYLPGGDKALITRQDSTTAAVEAALEVGGWTAVGR